MNITALVRKYYELLDRGNVDGTMELCSDDMSWRFSGMGTPDKAGLQGLIEGFRGAFPDMEHIVDDQLTEGDTVVTPGKDH